jgi:hypothetical protein
MAIDERRAFFRTNKWDEASAAATDVRQVWFAGCHSDVGGGFPNAESGLSKISLGWMLKEAKAAGLVVDAAKEAAMLTDPPPDPKAPLHDSLTGFWWLGEWVPQRPYKGPDGTRSHWRLPLGSARLVPEQSWLHQSVLDRIAAGGYRPANLPAVHRTEPW